MRRAGWGGTLRLTGDKREALEGADFVIVQLRVGGNKARYTDERSRWSSTASDRRPPARAGSRRRCGPCRSCSIWPTSRRRSARPARGSSTSRTQRASSRRRCWTMATVRLGCATWRSAFSGPSPSDFGVEPDRVQLEHVGLNHLTWERKVLVDGTDRLPELLADPPLDPGEDEFEGMPDRVHPRARRDPELLPALLLPDLRGASRTSARGRRAPKRSWRSRPGCSSSTRSDAGHETQAPGGAWRRVLLRRGRRACRLAARRYRRRTGRERPQRRRDLEPGRRRRRRGHCTVDRAGAHPLARRPLAPEMFGLVSTRRPTRS